MTARATALSIDQLKSRIGDELGVSDWHEVTQEAINAFADATLDHQFIHVDPERARATPFGGTIAHGYYTLSLAPHLLDQIVSFEEFAMGVNYGLDKLRFPAPLPVGESVRVRATLDRVDEFDGGAQLAFTLTFERSGGGKPVCVASVLYRVYTGGA
jgi:acyl dehydratase